MRVVFAGTPEFAAAALAALLDAGVEVALVLSQPDRPAGRGLRTSASPVKALALARGLRVATPSTFSARGDAQAAAAAHALLRQAAPDVLVVAAYGLILPQSVLDIPRGLPDAGCGPITAINIHASLLPRWRGAAPVARAIEAGDRETGITIMQMDAGLDTGPMLLREALPIEPADTTATLTARLASLGGRLIVQALTEAAAGRLRATPQPVSGVTYARKLDKSEAWLDWREDAQTLARKVRAFDPFPVAAARSGNLQLRIWRAHATDGAGAPGTVLWASAQGLAIACGVGALVVTELQRPGGRRLPVREFLAGARIEAGRCFELPTR
ncbi:MAG: methionyl-tRNA formyltransferase [Sutterellaceae bacterium]|nr:methionyl-tRNA formyltransferase [Burkholderiaceae bacterium]MCX7900853.1 methionyl-tRNA formyltransferase [Burkholderiaceae bacterium]MDW8429282.1 methionyl-tRNA formyltransferase [Sutterellaceae bacterium]